MSIGSVLAARLAGGPESFFLYDVSARAVIEVAPYATTELLRYFELRKPVTEEISTHVLTHALMIPPRGTLISIAALDQQTIRDRLSDPGEASFLKAFTDLTLFGDISWTAVPTPPRVAHRTYKDPVRGGEAAIILLLRGTGDQRGVLDLSAAQWAEAKEIFKVAGPPKDNLDQLRSTLQLEWMDQAELSQRLAGDPEFRTGYVSLTASHDPPWPPIMAR